MKRFGLIALLVLAAAAAAARAFGDRQELRAQLAEIDSLKATGVRLEAKAAVDRAIAVAERARADSLEAHYQSAIGDVTIETDTTLIVLGSPAPIVVPRAVVARIQVADVRGNQWKAVADSQAVLIADLDSLLVLKDSVISKQAIVIEQLRPHWSDRVNVTVGADPLGRPTIVLGYSALNVGDVRRALVRIFR